MLDFRYVSQTTGLYTELYIGDYIAKGSFGSVYKVFGSVHLVCKKVPVIEHRDHKMTKTEVLNGTIKEIHALKKMGLLEGYLRQGNVFYIIMKKVEGEHLDNFDLYSRDYLPPVFQALRDCHRKDVTHFDTHGKNFIAQSETKFTAIDFGQSQEATFTNIFLDTLDLIYPDAFGTKISALKHLAQLFINDYINYVKHNKLEVITNFMWWGALFYGACYGMPLFMLPNQFFYQYLRSKILHQFFLEARSLAFGKKDIIYRLLYFILPQKMFYFLNKHEFVAQTALKLPYMLACYWSYAELNYGFSSKKESTLPPSSPLIFQAALLYQPIKTCVQFVDDTLIKPIEPECVTKARADLYFKYHPRLYLKMAEPKLRNARKAFCAYFKPLRLDSADKPRNVGF